MAALDFPLGFDLDEMVYDSLTGTCTLFDDNYLSSTTQVQFPADKSPFHESDSGVSDITGSASPGRADVMLDEILDNKQFTPFGLDEDEDNVENGKNFLDCLEQDDIIDVDGSSDIQKLLRQQCFKENQHGPQIPTTVTSGTQAVVRQNRKRCNVGGNAGPVTRRQTAAVRMSTDSSLSSDPESELSKAVSLIDNDSDFDLLDCVDDEDYQPRAHAGKAKGSVRIAKPGTPIMKSNHKPASNNGNIVQVASEPSQSGVKSVKVLQVVRTDAAGQNAADDVMRALEDRNRKNAEQARVNRQKKKAYVQNLEQKVEESQAQVEDLQKRLKESEADRESWKKEVEYLKAVLANQSALAGLLKNIPQVDGVRLSSSFVSRKRSAEMDHSYTPNKKQCLRPLSSAGVCLHVDSDNVSLEFCHHCAQKAKATSNST